MNRIGEMIYLVEDDPQLREAISGFLASMAFGGIMFRISGRIPRLRQI